MAIFEVWGGLDSLPTGETRTYNRWDSGSSDGTYVSVIGCAGREAYNWDYDNAAEEVEVTVSENPETGDRVYDFTARFDEPGTTWSNSGRTSELNGSFIAR